MPKVMTQEEFLVKATLKHGQYNYSQAKYSGWDSILTIICPLHGSFEQRAFKHLSGHGCSECGKDKIKKVLSKSQDKFVNYLWDKPRGFLFLRPDLIADFDLSSAVSASPSFCFVSDCIP